MARLGIAAALSALAFGAVAAGGSAWAADPTLEFDGTIGLAGQPATDPFVAVYTYDPSTASTSLPGGGDVVTQYNLLNVTLTFDGASYSVVAGEMDGSGSVLFDQNASVGYQIFEAGGGNDSYSINNAAEIAHGMLSQGPDNMFRIFNSDGSVTTYDMTVDHVSAAPEPADWVLMVGGVALAGAALRSRRRRDAGLNPDAGCRSAA